MEVSLPNEACVDLHSEPSSANLPKPAEDQWMDKKQDFEVKHEPGITTQDANKDVNSAKMQHHRSNSKNVHKCSVCHKRFSCASKLKRHCFTHTDEKPFSCRICFRNYKNTAQLTIHLQNIHRTSVKQKIFFQSKRYKIVSCGQASKSRVMHPLCNRIGKTPCVSEVLNLQTDVNSRDEQPTNMDLIKMTPVVEICNFLKSDLEIIKGHWCPICLKCLQCPSKLILHIRSHTKEKPFKCTVCSKAYQQKSDLNVHNCKGKLKLSSSLPDVLKPVEKSLNGNQETPLRMTRSNAANVSKDEKEPTPSQMDIKCERKSENQCNICLKCFEYHSALVKHLLSHTDERPFKCNLCSNAFKSLSNLRRHLMLHKKLVKKNVSPVSKSSDVMSKCELETKSEYQCEICLKTFFDFRKLRRHIPVHLNVKTCTICGKTFTQACHLYEHMNLHKENEKGFSKLFEIVKQHAAQTSTPETNNDRLGDGNVSLPPVNDKMNNSEADVCKDTDNFSPTNVKESKGANQCNICLKCFEYPSVLVKHLLIHSDIRPFKCNVCSKAFKIRCHLRRHKMIHKKSVENNVSPVSKSSDVISECELETKSGYQCEICLKTFVALRKLRRHLPVHLNVKTCTICRKTFTQAYHLYKHMMLHKESEKGFSKLLEIVKQNGAQTSTPGTNNDRLGDGNVSLPPVNGKMNNSEADVCKDTDNFSRTNVRKSEGVNQCNICLRCFKYPSKLVEHRLSHTDIRPFKCNVCSKTFRNQSHLCRHKIGHKNSVNKNVTPVSKSSDVMRKCELKTKSGYECEICLKTFFDLHKLRRHIPVHLNVKTCTICGKTFTQACHLYEHMMLHKENKKGFSKLFEIVKQNGAQTSTPGTNNNREADVYKDTDNFSPTNVKENEGVNQCNICLKIFPHASKLYSHLLSHADVKSFKCNVCSKSFQHLRHLRRHKMIHKKRSPPVSKSSTERQLKKKSGHQCKICLKSFTKAYNLSKHLLLHTRKRNNSLKKCEVTQENEDQSSTPGTLDGKENCGMDDTVSLPQTFDNTKSDGLLECNSMLNQHVPSTEKASSVENEINGTEESRNPEVQTSTSSPTKRATHIKPYKKSHTNAKPIKCNGCSKSFQHRRQLRWHQTIHKKRVCPVSYYIMHARQIQKNQYRCELCLKSFRHTFLLENHLKSHTEEENSLSKLCDIPQESQAQSSTSETLDRTNNCGLDVGNLSSPQSLDSMDIQTNEMLECNSTNNQNVSSTKSNNIEIESSDDLESEEVLTSASTPLTNLKKRESVNPCSICQKVFMYPYRLARHLLIHTDIRPFKCKVCSKSFRSLSHLKRHQLIHIKAEKMKKAALKAKSGYKCKICWKVFTMPYKLKRHLGTHLNDKTYNCTICGKSFRQAYQLDQHLMVHSEEKNNTSKILKVLQQNEAQPSSPMTLDGTDDYGLDGDNVSFPQTDMASITVEIDCNDTDAEESKDKDTSSATNLQSKGLNQCTVCLKIFQCPSMLARHVLTHTNIKPYECNVCSSSFKLIAALRRHQKIHKRPVPPEPMSSDLMSKSQLKKGIGFQCEVCWKTFSAFSKLQKHHRIHLDIKTYICTVCGDSFKQSSNLERHMKIHARERKGSPKLCEFLQQNEAQSSRPLTLDGTNEFRLDGGNVSSPQILDSFDTQTNRNCFLNQNVPSTDMASITVEIEDNDIDPDTYRSANFRKSVNQCSICLKIFQYPSGLVRHLLTHTNIRPSENILMHKRKGRDIVAEPKEQGPNDSFGYPVLSKNQVFSQDGADDSSVRFQGQNVFTNNMLSQKMSGDSSDSGVFFSSSTSFLQNVQVNPTSEVAFQYSNKSVYGLTHNIDFPSLVEKTVSGIVPFGRVSECPPKTDSRSLYCASDSKAEDNWTSPVDEIEKDFSLVDSVKHDHDSYMSHSCPHPQKLNDPQHGQEVGVGHFVQDKDGHFTQPPCDILVCPNCSQCFSNESELCTHTCKNTHPKQTSRNVYECDICFKVFDQPSKLRRHSISHTDERPFQCTVCQRTYKRRYRLKEHILKHNHTQVEGVPQALPNGDQPNENSFVV